MSIEFEIENDSRDGSATKSATSDCPGLRVVFAGMHPNLKLQCTIPFMSLNIGKSLGAYEIVSHIGSGGMGDVYRARDPRLGRDVAIKVLPSGFAEDPDRLQRFEQEARAAGCSTIRIFSPFTEI